jgi:hypothetical protein
VQDLVELLLLVPRLIDSRVAINSRDETVWLALSGGSRVVPLALVGTVVVVPFAPVVIVALGEAVTFMVLLVGPLLHHVMELHEGLGTVAPKVLVEVPLGEVVLEAVDDILVGDVGDSGAVVEETSSVRPQGLVLLLLALRQVMTSTFSKHEALEVVNEDPLQVLPGVDGICLEAFEPGDRCWF